MIEQVLGGLGVPVQRHLQSVLQECEVHSDVGRVGLLPAQVLVGYCVGIVAGITAIQGVGECAVSSGA